MQVPAVKYAALLAKRARCLHTADSAAAPGRPHTAARRAAGPGAPPEHCQERGSGPYGAVEIHPESSKHMFFV